MTLSSKRWMEDEAFRAHTSPPNTPLARDTALPSLSFLMLLLSTEHIRGRRDWLRRIHYLYHERGRIDIHSGA